MNDLVIAVTAFWGFLWPSVIHFVITVTIVLYLKPEFKRTIKQFLSSVPIRRLIRFLRSKTAEVLGIPKLVPLSLVFMLLLVLVVSKDLAEFIGSITPPILVHSSPSKFLAMGSTDQLLSIWRVLPPESKLIDLGNHINIIWDRDKGASGSIFREERVNTLSYITSYLKFYLVLALVMLAIVIRNKKIDVLVFLKFSKIVSLLMLFLSLSITYQLHCHSRLVSAKITTSVRAVNSQDFSSVTTQISSEILEERRKLIENRKESGVHWWRLASPVWNF